MSLKRDSVTSWTRANGEAIANHRSQPLPKTSGGIFGGSVFGLASRTLGITAPGILGRLSPTDLFDGKALAGLGKDWILSKAGAALNQALAGSSRTWLESRDHNNLLGSTTGYRLNHEIENRGYLQFRFPEEAYDISFLGAALRDSVNIEGLGEVDTFSLPFFENPKITESRSAEYASHKIVNRNEPYRLWTGAKPLKVSLSFNITLPHLMTFAENQMKECVKFQLQSQEFKDALLEIIGEKLPLPFGGTAPNSNDVYEISNNILTDMNDPKGVGNSDSHRSRLILYCIYLINLIRSSVLGSSNIASETKNDTTKSQNTEGAFVKTYLPAPVIFLTYGSMYNNSPFIATNYSITFDGKSGYEELSLLPRVIQVKLTLESYNQFENSDKIFGVPKLFGYEGEA